MEILWRLIALAGVVATFWFGFAALRAFRKARRMRARPLLLTIGTSLVSLPVYLLLSGARLSPAIGWTSLALGLLAGLVWGLTTQLYFERGQLMGRHSLVALGAWLASWVLAQGLGLTSSTLLVAIGLVPLCFTTGTTVGTNTNLLMRTLVLRPAPAKTATLATAAPQAAPPRDTPKPLAQTPSPAPATLPESRVPAGSPPVGQATASRPTTRPR